MASSLADVLSRNLLLQRAGMRSYERGEDYFERDQVRSLAQYEARLTAKVLGTQDYQVQLWVEDGQLMHRCTCPLGAEDIFCKHCVAVGLAWLADSSQIQSQAMSRPTQPDTTMQDVRDYLEQQDQQALVELILNRAMEDTDWREQLLMKVAANRSEGPDIDTFERALSNAIVTGGFIDYGEARNYARGIETVVNSVRDLLDKGHADGVVELCEYALPLLEEALNSVDDSNGSVGGLLEEVQQLHHQACEVAKPDPEDLAKRLFWWEMNTAFDTFYGAVDTYADVLEERGTVLYRQLAEAEWERLPALAPGQQGGYDHKRWRLTRIMEQLAKQSGDLETIVAIKQRDLSQAYHYLEIAQLYQQAGQHDRALEWAEQGLQAFPERTDYRLRDFLVEEYQRRKRFEEAMALLWAQFTESPNLMVYQKLKTQAQRAKRWPEWRERALAHLRQHIAQATQTRSPQKSPVWGFRPIDHSILVEVFLWEGEDEQAWQEARTGGCSRPLWLRLAERRQQAHPEDALSIYQREIEPLIEQTNNQAYAEAVGFLEKVRDLMHRLGRQEEFTQRLAHLRKTYKRKRNFIKLLDQRQE